MGTDKSNAADPAASTIRLHTKTNATRESAEHVIRDILRQIEEGKVVEVFVVGISSNGGAIDGWSKSEDINRMVGAVYRAMDDFSHS